MAHEIGIFILSFGIVYILFTAFEAFCTEQNTTARIFWSFIIALGIALINLN